MSDSTNIYLIGNVVRMTARFTVAGSAIDPVPTPVCSVKDPKGQITTPQVTKDSTGVYRADFTPTRLGKHTYRWAGEGDAKAAAETVFLTRKSEVA